MHTDRFIEEIKEVGKLLGLPAPLVIQGEELNEKGFGGIYGVGKAAVHKPALVVLSHTPAAATRTVAWVGKGIVYDTGGLSIKVHYRVLTSWQNRLWRNLCLTNFGRNVTIAQ